MQDTSGVFDFGLAGGVTLAESWTVFESQLSCSGAPGVQREGDLGMRGWERQGRAGDPWGCGCC